MDDVLLALAARQGFGLTRQQILAVAGPRWLRRATDGRRLLRFHPGVYEIPDPPQDLRSRLRRLQLCTDVPLIACGPTAASLYEWAGQDSDVLHVTSAAGRSLHLPAGVVAHQWVSRAEPVVIDGLLVTDPADTAIDVATGRHPGDILAALDSAARAGVDPELLRQATDRAAGRRGLTRVRALVPHCTPFAESVMESRTRQIVLEAGFTDVEVQISLDLPTGRRRIDMGFRRVRVGIEYDGEDFHTGDGSLADDRDRHNAVAVSGWILLHVTKKDIWRPQRFLAQLDGVLNARGYRRPGTPELIMQPQRRHAGH